MRNTSTFLLIAATFILVGCAVSNLTRGVSPVCEVHGTQMTKTNVPILYGLLAVSEWGRAYDAARQKNFPHVDDDVEGGCIVGRAKQAIIYVCPQCLRAQHQWTSEHPRPPKFTTDPFVDEWVGFDTGHGEEAFRLVLNRSLKGELIEVFTLRDTSRTNEVHRYRYEISRWYFDTNDLLQCEFIRRDANDPLKLTGTVIRNGNGLTALLRAAEDGWKINILLFRAKDLDENLKMLRQ